MRVIAEAPGLVPLHGCTLVPTMGALHEGHLALIRAAAEANGGARKPRPIVVTIFVNPTQFNDPKDLDRYPRTLEKDLAGCERAGADAVFAPSLEVMYPPGETIAVPTLPRVATEPGLEDRLRPGHFAGVCQVVKRLFDLTRPARAYFGEKDWQQLRVISAMVEREGMGIEIVGVPTVRESDGLAMSSRNVFLKGEERVRARALSEALCTAAGMKLPTEAEKKINAILAERGLQPEYAVVRDAATLMPFVPGKPGRALIAARLGTVRLIDNAPWPGA
jgi:pantoate--beta-alanine ligase